MKGIPSIHCWMEGMLVTTYTVQCRSSLSLAFFLEVLEILLDFFSISSRSVLIFFQQHTHSQILTKFFLCFLNKFPYILFTQVGSFSSSNNFLFFSPQYWTFHCIFLMSTSYSTTTYCLFPVCEGIVPDSPSYSTTHSRLQGVLHKVKIAFENFPNRTFSECVQILENSRSYIFAFSRINKKNEDTR